MFIIFSYSFLSDFIIFQDVAFPVRVNLTSSIFVAIQNRNHDEVLRHLANDPGAMNNNQESPVHLACRLGYMDVSRCLIDNGCQADLVTQIGSPVHSLVKAVKCGYTTDVVSSMITSTPLLAQMLW